MYKMDVSYYLCGKTHGNVMLKLRSLRKSEKGAVAITVALSLVVMLALSAVAINVARVIYARQALQATMDSAMTAASADALTQTIGTSTDTNKMVQIAQNYFLANYNLPAQLVPWYQFQAQYINNATYDDSIVGTLDAKISIEFLGLISSLGWSQPTIPIHIESVAQRPRAPPLEMALVLDVTYSMSDIIPGGRAKYLELRDAADGLAAYVLQSPDARIGLVPFTQFVNIGTGFNTEPWLAVAPSIQQKDLCKWIVQPTCQPGYWSTCPKPDAVGQTIPCWKGGTCTGGVMQCDWRTISFQGCVAPRMINASTPSPDISNPTNPKYPGPVGTCWNPLFMDLSGGSAAATTAVRNRIKSLSYVNVSSALTFMPIGLIWGWNMLDPAAPLTSASSLPATAKAAPNRSIVLVTDGDNTYYPNVANNSQDAQNKANQLTLNVCNNIKSQSRIKIYTVAVNIPSASTVQLLRDCASDPSKAFVVTSASQLTKAFEQIGKSLSYNSLVK